MLTISLQCSDVVRPQGSAIPHVETTVRHHRVGPGLFLLSGVLWLIWWTEAALLTVGLGRGFDQCHIAVLAVDVQMPVGCDDRAGSDAFRLPPNGARLEVGSHEHAVLGR